MSTMIYGRSGESLRVEPVQPSVAVDSKPNTPTTQKGDQWRPHFEISFASNDNLETVLMYIGLELKRRAKSGRYDASQFEKLGRIIEGCKP